MHKYMRTIGFSTYQDKFQTSRLLRRLQKEAEITISIDEKNGTRLCELRAETAPGMGIVMVGQLSEKGTFTREYYFPYVLGNDISSKADCSIQRHIERETYAGLLDEYKVGISLIFYIENSMEYRLRRHNRLTASSKGAILSGLSTQGKILFPVQKTRQQVRDSQLASKKRSSLLEAAKHGDEEAIETLTLEDMDLYSMVSKRITREDIYSIIETCFMPCGVECDQYSVIGNILDAEVKKNRITEEEIYVLKLECNDMIFPVAINKKDLLGEPKPGRRFKGSIWMQGTVRFNG